MTNTGALMTYTMIVTSSRDIDDIRDDNHKGNDDTHGDTPRQQPEGYTYATN